MDIFRKKKIKKLLNELEDVNNILIQERCKTTKLQERINNLEKISTQTLEENQILMEWIKKILDTFGTMKVKSRMNVQIPIYEHKIYKASEYDRNVMGLFEKEVIRIPAITIIKMG